MLLLVATLFSFLVGLVYGKLLGKLSTVHLHLRSFKDLKLLEWIWTYSGGQKYLIFRFL